MRTTGVLVLSAVAFAASAGELFAQELTLKRDLPPLPANACEASGFMFQVPSVPSAEAQAEAEELASEANVAQILGEYQQARELWTRAAAADATSPSISYGFARLLEDGGESEVALSEYCRFLMLTGDPEERAEVEARIERIGIEMGLLGAGPAREAFEEGVEAFDAGDYDGAVQDFSRALVESPDWDQAHFNRALAYLRSGRDAAGAADLEWYLELAPDADDRVLVQARLDELGPVVEAQYSPGTAFVSGLVPGMGHFYTGRPGMGMLILGAAGGAAAAGLLYEKLEIECLSPPVNGECPPGEDLSREVSRPLLVPGLAAAGAITILGAISAYRGARPDDDNFQITGGLPGIEGSIPRLSLGEAIPRFRMEPVFDGWGGGVHAEVEVRF